MPHSRRKFSNCLISFLQIQPPSPSCPAPPLFLPSDPPLAWLLAKIWVRNSDFQLHQLQYHLLNTHLVAEVIAVATMRCLPGLHPVFKVRPLPSVPQFTTPERGDSPMPRGAAGTQKRLRQLVNESGETRSKTGQPETRVLMTSSHLTFLRERSEILRELTI